MKTKKAPKKDLRTLSPEQLAATVGGVAPPPPT
jgi:hypothetical protein